MTHVTIYRNREKECIGFTAIGHADYAESGEDLVCAAISVLAINTCNAVEQLTGTAVSLVTNEEEGLIDCRLKDAPSEQTGLLISAMILGIESIADNKDYEEYIQLSFEEV